MITDKVIDNFAEIACFEGFPGRLRQLQSHFFLSLPGYPVSFSELIFAEVSRKVDS